VAERQIAAARATALGALRQVATETATTVVNRLTGMAPDVRAIDPVVGTGLAARGQGSQAVMAESSFYQSPAFWVAVAFVLFFVFFGRKLWKALTGMLDKRADEVRVEL